MSPEIKKLSPRDLAQFKDLIRVFEAVFEMEAFQMPDDPYLQKLLENDGFWAFVAISGGTVIGGLTAYTLQQYYSRQPLVYLYDLAVQTEFQRQGIGKMLLAEIKAHSRKTGVEEVFVQADLADDHALEFYRTTGGIAANVVHFSYPLPAG
jgi:aminoglycoside 3-N-acetyltransferase I